MMRITYIVTSELKSRRHMKSTSTSVLSTRWRHLPWLLPELSIDVQDFLSAPCADPIDENDMEQAMASLTKETMSFLNKQQREFTISSLHLNLYLINTFLHKVGPLIGDAINSGLLKDLDLGILDKTWTNDRSDEEMQQRAQHIDGFFTAYPCVLHCLTKLFLKNVGFEKLDMHHVLFNSCKQLKHLTLYHCDTGSYSIFKIDAPDSKLCVPEIDKCRFLRVDLVCLPKLDKFFCDYWVSRYAPLTFGFVPSLGELELSSGSVCEEHIFKLTELLHGVTSIHTLTLDFQGETPYIIDGALSENSPYGGFEHSGIPDGIPQLEEYLAVHDLGLQQIGSCTLPFHYFEGHLSMQEYTTDGLWVMLQAVSILDLPARLAMLWLIVPGITLIEKMS